MDKQYDMKKIIKRFTLFQRSVAVTFIFSMLGSVLNYFCQIITGNLLSVEEFGIYNAINSLAANLVIVFTPLSIMACQMTAANSERPGCNRGIYMQLAAFSGILIIIMLFLGGILYQKIEGRFGVRHIGDWIVLLLMVGISGLYNIAYSVVQGLKRFVIYGIIGSAFMIIKLVAIVTDIKIGIGISGIIYALFFSYFLVLILTSLFIRQTIGDSKTEKIDDLSKQDIFKLYGLTFVSQILISFYLNGGEIILMNFKYDERAMGLYSSAVTLGKVCLYVISVISVVLLPTVAGKEQPVAKKKAILYKSVLISLMLAIIYVIFLLTIGKNLILFFFGDTYKEALEYIPYIAIFVIPLSIISVVHNFFIGIGKVKEYTCIFGAETVLIIGLVWFWVDDIKYVPAMLGIGLSMVLCIALFYVKKKL